MLGSDEDEDEYERQQEDEGKQGGSEMADLERQDDYEDDSSVELGQDPAESERKYESSRDSSQSSSGHNPLSDDGNEISRRGVETSDGKGPPEGLEEVADDYTPMYVDAIRAEEVKCVDYESNEAVWIPPAPGIDQDDSDAVVDDDVEAGTSIGDDDDDDDDDGDDEEGGGWGVAQSPGSVSSVVSKKDKTASSEHRKSIRPQIAGDFRNLVAQLLQQGYIDAGEAGNPESWLEIVSTLSWQAASLVKPDTSNGGGMDPGGYVKVKCIASGRPSDSVVVKGIVCRKTVAHKRMTTRYKNPRLLLLGGALEYQRVSNQLSSLDTLLQQERDHLSMTVARIEAHHPNVLLVEKTVSRFAQDILLEKDITLVLNVKKSLLERIARCVGAQVVPSPDNLVAPKAVHCELFHVEKFVEEHGSGGQGSKQSAKSLMFFEGVPKPLGCTVLLKGANGDYLKKIKHVMQLAVFSAYHLALETSFLADEGATLPEIPCRTPLNTQRSSKYAILDKSVSSVGVHPMLEPGQTQQARAGQSSNMLIPPLPSSANAVVASAGPNNLDNSLTTIYNAVPVSASSSCVSSAGNSPGTSPAQSSFGFQSGVSRSQSIGGTSTTTYHHISNGVYPGGQSWQGVSGLSVCLKREADKSPSGQGNPEGASPSIGNGSLAFEVKALEVNTVTGPSNTSLADQTVTTTASMLSKGTIRERGNDYHIVPEEVQAHLRVLIQNNWQSEMQLSKEDFPPSPSNQESILVQLSSRCLTKGTVCKPPHFMRIYYYGNQDKPLGRFLRDQLFDTNNPCRCCEEPGDVHVHCFTHRQGSLTISVRRLRPDMTLSGERDGRIWMWHRCLRCPGLGGIPPATPRVIMSDAAWGLSFGKFLELSFSTHSAASRVAACGHSLHRDCLRFYGFGNMVACFRYGQIILHSVHLPPLRLEFNCPHQQDWLRKEVDEVSSQANLVFVEAVNKLRVLGEKVGGSRAPSGSSAAHDAKRRIFALEVLLQKEKAAFEESIQKAVSQVHHAGQPVADILELNWLRRELYVRAAHWDSRLDYFASSLPNRKRATGSIDDSNILSVKELNVGNGTVKAAGSRDAEGDSTRSDALTSDIQQLPNDVESNLGSNVGSNPSERKNIENDASGSQVSSGDDGDKRENINSSLDPVGPTELKDGNGLDFRLEKEPQDGDLLEKIEVTGSKAHLSSSFSMSVESPLAWNGSMPDLEGNGENGSTEAAGQIHSPTHIGFHAVVPCEFSSIFSQGDVTARRALSEGSFPLLADLSDALEPPRSGDGGSTEGGSVHSVADQPLHSINVNDAGHDTELEGVVQQPPSMDQTMSDSVAQQGDLAAVDKGASFDAQTSVPTSLLKSDSPEDLPDSWTPFSSFVKGYVHTPSNLSTSSDAKWPPSGPGSVVPRAAQLAGDGGARVFLPPGHADVVVAVYDDEPTSVIAYALSTEEHYVHVTDILVEKEKSKEKDQEKDLDPLNSEQVLSHPVQMPDVLAEVDVTTKEIVNSSNEPLVARLESEIQNPLISTKASQLVKKTINFCDEAPNGKVKFQVTCYFAKPFDALRKQCCMGNAEYIRSLCHCKKWGAQGGKSNVFFAKTADDRFVVKQVTRTELTSFLDFASAYFKYLNEALTTGNPTCLAKIFGVYEVKITKGGKETKMDLLVMENLLYGRHITRLYDLKGSVRSRYNADSSGKNQVLLDQNLVEAMPTNPIFVGNKAKRLLERGVWNDTHFLSLVFVMDYSLLVGVDEERQELVVGIIDFIRQYTWDKHLETWVKGSGFLGGPKNAAPTVISPKQYKKRFRKAMTSYFLMVPDQWIPPSQLTVPPLVDTVDDNSVSIVIKREDLPDDADTHRQQLSGQ